MTQQIPTGVAGLDEIFTGGLLQQKAYLLRGGPGTGKTTMGLHFLAEGRRRGESSLFISLGEKEEQIRHNGRAVGLDLDGTAFLDLSPTSRFFEEVESYDIFSAAEVEREPVTRQIVECVRQHQPKRVFLDSMTQFRYLAPDAFQFRKQALSFLRFLTEQGATVLFTSEASIEAPDDDLMFLSDGIVHLEYTSEGRYVSVSKFRGSDFLGGRHSYVITPKGVEVYPRLIPEFDPTPFNPEVISSGVPELDELLHGGIERGTVTLVSGPSGVGKTTMCMLYMKEAAGRGERSKVYTFEETEEKLIARCEAVNIPARAMIQSGNLAIERIEPLALLPDQFANRIRVEIQEHGTRVIMIDSTSGYEMAMKGVDTRSHLHAVCRYMANQGVAVLLPTETPKITGDFQITDHNISYLADNIVFMRYLEMGGEMKRAIGVLKKRLSDFEKTLREYRITRFGIKVGAPLTGLRNILSGTPQLIDGPSLERV